MTDLDLAILLITAHELLCAALLFTVRREKRFFLISHALWILLIPVFGPIAAYALVRAYGRTPPDAGWFTQQEDKHRLNIVARNSIDLTVPLEEALLINDPQKRRNIMMNILRSDPMRYLDLLLIARFNDDTETAHYATASIMELQRHFQLELQQLQLELEKRPKEMAAHRRYVEHLSRYCESGLLEGQLLRRQQLLLEQALRNALSIETDAALLRIKVSNCLALRQAEEAKNAAHMLIRLQPMEEGPWLEAMRVYAETHDQEGMRALLKRMEAEQIDFTGAGREHLLFFRGLQA
ncbi:MAG: hypothetical protein GX418_14625 [Clostridiales bacterium]|nr:hypothetical protein [Clostridiales bacterium]